MGAGVGMGAVVLYCSGVRPFLAVRYKVKKRTSYVETSVPGSVVGMATGYGLDGPGIKSPWGRDFPHLSRPALGPTQPPVQWVPALSRG